MEMEDNKIDWKKEYETLKRLLEVEKKTYKEVSEMYGCSYESVYSARYHLGIKYQNDFRVDWTDNEIDRLRILLNSGYTYTELEKEFEGRHSIQSISGIIKSRGKNLNLKYQGEKRFQFTPEIIEKIRVFVEEDYLTAPEISKKLGENANESSISKIILKSGIKRPTKDQKIRAGYVDNIGFTGMTEEILKEKIESGTSFNEIAESFGVDSSTVARRAKYLGIFKPEKEVVESPKTKKYLYLQKFLNREPTSEEYKTPLYKFFKKDYIEDVYKSTKYNNKLSSEIIGISISEFQKVIDYLKIDKPQPIRISDYSDEFYENLFVKEGKSYSDIAEIIGLKEDTIRKYLSSRFPEGRKFGKYSSRGEKTVAEILDSLNLSYKYNDPKSGVVNDTIRRDGKVYIDFVLEYSSKTYWIEYNGKQHYSYVEYFYPNEEAFLNQRLRDKYVRDYCSNNNIILLEIPYIYRSTSQIQEIIEKVILGGENITDIIDYSKFSILK